MPYKDKETKKKHDRDYIQKKRGTTNEGDDKVGTTEEMFEGKPRYLTLSDGQVFDRTYQPKPNRHLPAMAACNRANGTDLSRGRSKAERLAMLLMALDKDVSGIVGKENLLTLVRYGVNGPTFAEIKEGI